MEHRPADEYSREWLEKLTRTKVNQHKRNPNDECLKEYSRHGFHLQFTNKINFEIVLSLGRQEPIMCSSLVTGYINKFKHEIRCTRNCKEVEEIKEKICILRVIHVSVAEFERNLISELDVD